MSTYFKSYLIQNEDKLFPQIVVEHSFQVIQGEFVVQNNTKVLSTSEFLTSYSSSIIVEDSIFAKLECNSILFIVTNSEFNLSNTQFYNITTTDNGILIFVSHNSVVSISQIEYYDSMLKFLYSAFSQVMISESHMYNLELSSHLLGYTHSEL